MKKTLLLTSILSLFILSSCKNEKTDTTENLTIENLKKTNDLFSFGEIHKGNFTSKSNYFNYSIVLDASNKTNNTFEKTIVEADLKLILQNNNVLSVKDTDKVLNLGSIEKITFWKPNQTKIIGNNKELYTQSLPNHFKEYPVKQVVLVLKLTASDIVNKTEETVVHNIDITEDWRSFLTKKENMPFEEQKKSFQNENLNTVGKSEIEKTNTKTSSEITKKALSVLNNGNKSSGDYEIKENKRKDVTLNSNKYYGDVSRETNFSIVGRKAISRPSPQNTCNEEGVVVVKVTVNREGEVIDALAGIKGTTTQSECLLKISKEAALKTKWESSEEANAEQFGSIKYNFKLR